MNKICTDVEQSKKLIELGIDVYTADMYWWICYGSKLSANPYTEEVKKGFEKYHLECIPAWSLSALINLLPSEFTEVGKYSTTTYEIHIRKYKFTDDVDLFQIAYGHYKFYEDGNSSWKDMINTGEKEELLDSAFQMICWLLENKKI